MLPEAISIEPRPGLRIRRADFEDFPAVLRLLSELHEADAQLTASPAILASYQSVTTSRDRALLVAVADSEVVATLDLLVIRNITRDGRPWAGVENVVVRNDRRCEGIGGALLDAAITLARDCGCYKVQLVSHAERNAAHDMYRSHGFTAPVTGYRRYLDSKRVSSPRPGSPANR
jgi:GNAT superfamily N-acetyltransferase